MNNRQAKEYLKYELRDAFDEREATQITRIIFEDLFDDDPVHPEAPFSLKNELESIKERLLSGEPVQHITGKAQFFEYIFKVNRHVLIPRPETEELVDWLLNDYSTVKGQMDILDVGTGSGCICISIKKKRPNWRVFGIENSLDALNVSRINARKLSAQIQFYRIDFLDRELWSLLGKFDVIISNPPYISPEDADYLSDQVRDFEPDEALFTPSDDVLGFYKALDEFSSLHLKPNGKLYVEMNEFQAPLIRDLYAKNGTSVYGRADMQGKDRMLRIDYG